MSLGAKEQTRASKFLSLVLRHEPDAAGVTLDEAGWCNTEALLAGCKSQGVDLSFDDLKSLVAENDKKRFQFSEDGASIRAVQGRRVTALRSNLAISRSTRQRFSITAPLRDSWNRFESPAC